MTAKERIQAIKKEIVPEGPYTYFQLMGASGYQGVRPALAGQTTPSAENLDKMEAGIKKLKGAKQ